MPPTRQQERRLEVLSCYQAYVDALHACRLNSDADQVRESRRALAHAIEAACLEDPDLLADFKRAFASHPLA